MSSESVRPRSRRVKLVPISFRKVNGIAFCVQDKSQEQLLVESYAVFFFTPIVNVLRFEIICIDLLVFQVNLRKKLRELF